ncbi:hypothetical protein OCS_05225 [Ophiocordyceps sinensis CO18]|uniref:Uncharacterized protein n=1 Tax=Ophiocordyceps sinensis (strain Co18 / CGMCC 3.14243) TaxID=911162 RepID=T5ABD1_OPHSC|nr:hypothetical protein OCS_05225 [Ophiocordyceps sinensis CO18]
MNDNVDPTTRPRRQSDTRPQGRHRHAQEGKAIPDLRDDTDTPKKAKRDVLRQHRAQAALGSANQSRSTGTARMNASKAPKSEELGAWSKKSCYLCGNAHRMRDCGEANDRDKARSLFAAKVDAVIRWRCEDDGGGSSSDSSAVLNIIEVKRRITDGVPVQMQHAAEMGQAVE